MDNRAEVEAAVEAAGTDMLHSAQQFRFWIGDENQYT